MKIIFMGTPEFALPVLKMLNEKHHVLVVYTQPPKPAGHGMKLKKSPVHVWAEEHDLPVKCPKNFRELKEQEEYISLKADLTVVCAYGILLPEVILNTPKKGCINVHASILPRWRGAAPIQRAIEAGDLQTGITIMQMDRGLDTGRIISTQTIQISNDMTGGQLHDFLAVMGAEALQKVLEKDYTSFPQPEIGVTYAHKIVKSETSINWQEKAEVIERKVRAFNPYPKMYFSYKGIRIYVLKSEIIVPEKVYKAGTILSETGIIACADGTALQLLEVQREGKKILPITEFLKGFSLTQGDSLAL